MFYTIIRNSAVRKIINLQLVLGSGSTILTAIFIHDIASIVSGLLGVLIAILPALLYIRIAFARGLVAYPAIALKRHQQAMFARFILSVVLFILAFIFYKHGNFILLFATYFATLSGYWFGLLNKKI